jgi:hypothetical protein
MESEKRASVTQDEDQVNEGRPLTDDEQRPSTADIAAGGDREPPVESESGEESERLDDDARQPLLDAEATTDVRGRWETIQGSFVDEPRRAVEEADALVAELMQQLADSFAKERQALEGQWDRGDEVSTEDLRIALQRYRSFFDRLLSA